MRPAKEQHELLTFPAHFGIPPFVHPLRVGLALRARGAWTRSKRVTLFWSKCVTASAATNGSLLC
jgi:hypothetical protein